MRFPFDEPATVLTDWVMAAAAAGWAAALLAPGDAGPGLPTLFWAAAFAATAVSAAAGGVVHGFERRMGPARTSPVWRATLHFVALASAAMLAGAILVFPDTPLRTAGLVLVALKLAAATVILARSPEFEVALADHAAALAAVVALQGAAWHLHDAPSAPWILGGIAVAAVAGTIQALRIAPHRDFDHNALYHVVQIVALWLLFRGGVLLGVT